MKVVTAAEARADLEALVEEVASLHKPIRIKGRLSNAILLSEEEWRGINATLELLSIPGMRRSILEGKATPLEECSEDVGW